MAAQQPRFEFRVWGERLDDAAARITSSSDCVGARRSSELYLVSRHALGINPKVRSGRLDIKELAGTERGFEQWRVRLKAEFPIGAADVGSELLAGLGVEAPTLARQRYTLEQLLREVVGPHPDLASVDAHKRRRFFSIGGADVELTDVEAAGRELQTVAAESVDPELLAEACRVLGLEGQENVSYPAAIRRVIGWELPSV